MFVIKKRMFLKDFYYMGKAGANNEWSLNNWEGKIFEHFDDAVECVLGEMGYTKEVLKSDINIDFIN